MPFRRVTGSDPAAGPNTHKVPRLPIMIDDTEADPGAVREFTGVPIYTVVDRDAHDGKMLRMFTSKEGADEYSRHLVANPESYWVPRSSIRRMPGQSGDTESHDPGAPSAPGYVRMYEHRYMSGCEWQRLQWEGVIRDFRGINCGVWPFRKNANDRVSSVDCYTQFTYVDFYEHIHFGGSWLRLPGVAWVEDLSAVGWNERASSMWWIHMS